MRGVCSGLFAGKPGSYRVWVAHEIGERLNIPVGATLAGEER
jgi:hypothetical protein